MNKRRYSQVIIITFLCFAMMLVSCSTPNPQPDKLAAVPQIKTLVRSLVVPTGVSLGDYWKVEIDIRMTSEQVKQYGGLSGGADAIQSLLNPMLANQPVSFGISSNSTDDGGGLYTLMLEGYNLDILRQVLFVWVKPVVDVMGLPMSIDLTGAVKQGDKINLLLSAIASTGQQWQFDQIGDIIKILSSEFECSHVAPGSPQVQTLIIEALKTGDANLRMLYQRLWESNVLPMVRITIRMGSLSLGLNLFSPNPSELSSISPVSDIGPVQNLGSDGVPSTLDWSSTNNRLGKSIMTSIKDQASCGSCWAFASVGVMEASIKLNGGSDTDLSEQYLVSCNQDNWSCNGGWWAHDYNINKQGKLSNPPGAVNESDMPYQAQNGTCKLIQNHPYKLTAWHSVGSENLSDVPAIKSAIYNYGPVASAVCASTEFQSYTGGVFSTQTCSNVNHAIIIVGWDDATESWKIKNSWGPSWGENGYMRIKWGVNAIGNAANYVEYGGGSNPTIVVPTKTNTPIPSKTPMTPTAVPSGTSKTATPPPSKVLKPGSYDDTNANISYAGQWYFYQGDGPANSTAHYSNSSGNSFSFSFNGSRFSIGFTGHPSRGIMSVIIDGAITTLFNEFGWNLKWQRSWNGPLLDSGIHSVTIQHAFGYQTDLDFINITGP